MKNVTRFMLTAMLALTVSTASAQRKMVHPGISYTQTDIDRMKAMIEAKEEPFYSAYQYLLNDRYTTYKDYDVTMLTDANGRKSLWFDESAGINRQYWFSKRGQIALNNALLWKLTGETSYADKAVTVLNSYIGIHSTVTYGTNCLDNGACTPLIEAAELLRDYEGWAADDQQGFKDFLVYPGYSTKESYYAKYATSSAETSECTIYWNIFMGDPVRHGNQGLYGMRCMMAMGIYLDNDTIYERALNKVLSQPHRSDDLPYAYGPFKSTGWKPSDMPAYNWKQSLRTGEACFDWLQHGGTWGDVTIGDTEDYGSDDELQYFIYENGQCQEAARDQGHVMDGLCNMTEIAKVAWNQGDDIFTQYDDRLLKGLSYAAKYNYSWRNNHYENGKFFDEDDYEPTVANGEFLQKKSRNNGFWSKKICPYSENDSTWRRGKMYYEPLQMLMAYKVILGRNEDSVAWLQHAVDINNDTLAVLGAAKLRDEDGMVPEYLSEYRTVWMAGDAGTFVDKAHVNGIPTMPGTINAVDYDFFNNVVSGNGRTFSTTGTRTDNLYREEGGMQIAQDGSSYVVTEIKDGSWMNYTVTVPTTATYKITVNAKVAAEGAKIGFAVDGSEAEYTDVETTDGYSDIELGSIKIKAGARVLRIYVDGTDDAVSLSTIAIAEGEDAGVVDYVWNSPDYAITSGKGTFLTDQSNTSLYSTSYSSTSQAVFTMAASEMNYRVYTDSLYLVMEGQNFDHAAMTQAVYALTEGGTETTKKSSNGISSQLSTTLDDGTTVVVWKLDSATNKRITPLLKNALSSETGNYILKGLTFLVYGTSLYKSTEITNVNFYTLDNLKEKYPSLFPEASGITDLRVEEGATDGQLYDLSGRKVNSSAPGRGLYIMKNKKFIVK